MPGKETVLEDWALVSFLELPATKKKYHLKITPFKKEDGRVAFRVSGDVEAAFSEVYENQKVPVGDFLKSLKSTRNLMFNLRSLQGAAQ